MALKTWKNKVKFPHLATLILLALVVIVLHLTRNNGDIVHHVLLKQDQDNNIGNENEPIPGCNLFSGRWIYDNVSYPLYKERECPFMEDDFACETYGRKDLKYQDWRWQPHQCHLPRYVRCYVT